MKNREIILGIVLVTLVCLFIWGGNIHPPPQESRNPADLKECLGVGLPSSASETKVQIFKIEGNLSLIAKFKISEDDAEKFATSLKMEKSDKAESVVPMGPLLDVGEPESAWWNPPQLPEQWKLKDRWLYTSSGKSVEDTISMVWVDGTAYLRKTGSYVK